MTNEEKMAEIKKQVAEPYISFDACPGWIDVIWNCHRELVELLPDYKLHQVKEKFGGLRFYYTMDESHDEDKKKRAREIVSFYERMSYLVCDECGTTLNVTTEGSWVRTLCDSCRLTKEVHQMEVPSGWDTTGVDDGRD